MGSLLSFCRRNANSIEQPIGKAAESTSKPVYSWDKRPKLDPKDYMVDGLQDGIAIKAPGSINGNQFIIQNCHRSKIFVFDHSSQVTIDDCNDCQIILGPNNTSVFFRDCQNCDAVVACQQFRTRDCRQFHCFLICATKPIIESSTAMKFSCYSLNYPELAQQFQASGLNLFTNYWFNVHDFTPLPEESNWSLISMEKTVASVFTFPDDLPVKLDTSTYLVPLSVGLQRRTNEGSCLLVFASTLSKTTEQVLRVIEHFRKTKLCLIQTGEFLVTQFDAPRIFETTTFQRLATQGPVIGLEYNGVDCIPACEKVLQSLNLFPNEHVYVSSNKQSADKEVDQFFALADAQMAI